MKKRVELLAPAGNYEAFLGAVNAGADAVYLGGEKFGARAYADNFTAEEICRAVHVAHFMGRKVYLTVNTLMKDEELEELVSFLKPFYEAGLDGVIVQDIGALCRIRASLPGLALHASTQMTLTGPEGCMFLKGQGVERVVPARELSLEEIREIKEKTGLEIECFIHGAMCYCYSGQCLFSSLLGGRSGNRGRCAQPCRLPYRILDGEREISDVNYPLSLKDMCTITYIPELIEAGIDSFKIEGRMKKAEYAAGVTAVYRKYIDLYYRKGKDNYKVEKADLQRLQSLYIRSELQTGYYDRHNGREMITIHKPGYAGSDDRILEQIRKKYIREPDRAGVKMKVVLETGMPAELQLTGEQMTVRVLGEVVEEAQKAPLRQEDVCRRFSKTGNSCVSVSSCEAFMPDNAFLTVRSMNELRRKGLEAFERQYILRHGMTAERYLAKTEPTESVNFTEPVGKAPSGLSAGEWKTSAERIASGGSCIDIRVSTCEQLAEAVRHTCRRIYVESDLYLTQRRQVIACMADNAAPEYYIALPYVLRTGDSAYMERLMRALAEDRKVTGFLVRSYEAAAWARNLTDSGEMAADAGLYCFNAESVRFWEHYCREYTLPYELNRKEAGELVRRTANAGMSATMVVYGRIPMMITANCIRKTAGCCSGRRVSQSCMYLKDRYEVKFPVEINCVHCYNVIYNSVPCSLHTQYRAAKEVGADVIRYDFTMETAEECRKILLGEEFPFAAYTTGHLKRGVE